MARYSTNLSALIFSLILISISLFLTNCGGRDESEKTGNADSVIYVRDTLNTDPDVMQPATIANNLTYFVDYDEKTIRKNPVALSGANAVDSVIVNLNMRYPKVIIEKLRTGHDTLYTRIKDSRVLGEQMGTSGAGEYFATAVFNLTAITGIRYVKIDMEEGSHASPGIFSKNDFSDFKEITGSKD